MNTENQSLADEGDVWDYWIQQWEAAAPVAEPENQRPPPVEAEQAA